MSSSDRDSGSVDLVGDHVSLPWFRGVRVAHRVCVDVGFGGEQKMHGGVCHVLDLRSLLGVMGNCAMQLLVDFLQIGLS